MHTDHETTVRAKVEDAIENNPYFNALPEDEKASVEGLVSAEVLHALPQAQPKDVRALAYKMAERRLIDLYRHATSVGRVPPTAAFRPEVEGTKPDDIGCVVDYAEKADGTTPDFADALTDRITVRDVIGMMPLQWQRYVELRRLGYRGAEIAGALGVSEPYVSNIKKRVCETLTAAGLDNFTATAAHSVPLGRRRAHLSWPSRLKYQGNGTPLLTGAELAARLYGARDAARTETKPLALAS